MVQRLMNSILLYRLAEGKSVEHTLEKAEFNEFSSLTSQFAVYASFIKKRKL